MDVEAVSGADAERKIHPHVGDSNNESRVLELASDNGLTQSHKSLICVHPHVGDSNNESRVLELASDNGLVICIRVKGASTMSCLTLLLLCGLTATVLEAKMGEDRWHVGFGIVVSASVALLMEWLVCKWQKLHLSDPERETKGEETQVQGSVCEKPEEPRIVLGGGILVAGVGMPTEEWNYLMEGARMVNLKPFFWCQFFCWIIVGVIFTVPLILTVIERRAGDAGLWTDLIKPGVDTLERLVGIVQVIERALVIGIVAVQEGLSLASISSSSASLVHQAESWTGRSVYLMTLQKSMQFQLAPILTVLVVNFVAVVFTGRMSLSVAQLLCANLIVVRLGELALSQDEPQRTSSSGLVDDEIKPPIWNITWRNLILQSFYQISVLLSLHFRIVPLLKLGDAGPEADKISQTVRFNVLVLCHIFNVVSARRIEEINVFQGLLTNYALLGVVGGTIALQVVLVEFGSGFISTVQLSWPYWILCIGIGFMSWPLDWLGKFFPVLPHDMRFRSLWA